MKAFLPCLLIVWLAAFASAAEFSLQATVTVNPAPIELDVNIAVLTKEVEQGEELPFLVGLSKQALGEITVDLEYEVVKRKGRREEVILTAFDSMQLTDFASKQAAIQVPADAKPGKYELRVTATYFNQSDFDRAEFFVKKAKLVKPRGFLQAMFLFFGWFI